MYSNPALAINAGGPAKSEMHYHLQIIDGVALYNISEQEHNCSVLNDPDNLLVRDFQSGVIAHQE